MAKKRLTQALQSLMKSALKLDRNLSVNDRFWLWRSSLISSSASPSTQAGFILPTVTLLLLMLSLVLGVLIFRTGNRTNQVIGERQQRQVYNAATPAIDRARSKLEFLFTQEAIPTLPSEANIDTALNKDDPYKLPDETRIDLDGDGSADDPAWVFTYDSKGDTTSDEDDVTVVYSILNRTTGNDNGTVISLQDDDETKAENLVVRNGPINLTGGAGNPNCPTQDRSPYQGWQNVTGAQLRKAFQVHAFAISGPNNPNQTVATLEMQQDKQANLGNKWGAWFRTDMEVFPGPAFRWNGAMNTAGSYFVRSNDATGDTATPNSNRLLGFYPISAPTSCVFTEDSSEMVMSLLEQQDKNPEAFALNNNQTFQGQFVVGSLRDNNFDGGVDLYGFEQGAVAGRPSYGELQSGNDSTNLNAGPINLALEPVVLLTEGINRRRDGAEPTTDAGAADRRDGAWDGKAWVEAKRLHNEYQPTPFVDDTYRADNRWGPKPVYSEEPPIVALRSGETGLPGPQTDNYAETIVDPATNEIPVKQNDSDNFDALRREVPLATNTTDEEGYGLDGYWERRAKAQGVRVIVGQRLELGNAYAWQRGPDLINNETGASSPDGIPDSFDPLYPPPANPGVIAGTTPVNSSMDDRQSELMQWKTLRNNPAAAQSTAIYHYLLDKGRSPAACLASAAHPGTNVSIRDSKRFNRVEGKIVPDVNFLTGQGTNGWEFAPFGAANYADDTLVTGKLTTAQLTTAHTNFATAVNDDDSPLRIALSNLAYFSGDLAGAFPAFQDSPQSNAANSSKFSDAIDSTVGPITHPYPILTMWGDFSNLRRVIEKLNDGETYDVTGDTGLSLADRTTLQTASCTLGILAYNIENQSGETKALSRGQSTALYRRLNALGDGDDSNGEIKISGTNVEVIQAGTGDVIYGGVFQAGDTPSAIPAEVIANALPTAADTRELVAAIQKEQQIDRDRTMGFADPKPYTVLANHPGGILGIPQNQQGSTINDLHCDFESNNYFNLGKPRRARDEQQFLTLAYVLCPRFAKYPSLYYLFPKANHDHVGNTSLTGTLKDRLEFQQPATEPYTSASLKLNGADFDNRYAYNNGKGVNTGESRFRVVGDNDNDGISEFSDEGIKAIALLPKAKAAWALPNENNGNGANVIEDAVTGTTASDVSISMLDTGIFNGREQMGVRLLNIDLDLLRNNTVTGSGPQVNEDYWLPLPKLIDPNESPTRTGAAIYAFREDAVREDGIARPRRVSPAADAWREAWRQFSLGTRAANYVMNAVAFNTDDEQDPPLNPANGLSPKAVDYYADPARRPHGFRLLNGIDLSRAAGDINSDGVQDDEDVRGMSFVSDNAVYIQGDFNIHSTNGTVANRIEEYEAADALDDTWQNFYERTLLNTDFARPETDTWRATEVVTDAINILSDDFADGWVSQGILNANGSGENRSSFRALNYPITDANNISWVTADGRLFYANGVDNRNDIIRDEGAPIKISQRGFPVFCAAPGTNDDISATPLTATAANTSCAGLGGEEREYGLQDSNQAFLDFEDERDDLQTAAGDNYVNALVVSGIIPSRVNQANGGLHNFPRTIEDWEGTDLWFGGSLFQLNFSTASTGPYDQDAWEPDGNNPVAGFLAEQEQIWYYRPPGRRWGYDVALQYVQPPPVAQRFAGRSNIRSEFFQELPVDDPYIALLRCVKLDNKQIDETATCN